MNNFFPNIRKTFGIQRLIFSSVLFVLCLVQLYHCVQVVRSETTKRRLAPSRFGAQIFDDFLSFIKQEKIVGYITNRNLKDVHPQARLAHAQYALAPVILDSDSSDYQFIIVDCSPPQVAMGIIKKLNAQIVNVNTFGVFLIKRDL